MIPAEPAALRYDRTSILLHWIVAGVVLTLWTLGQVIDYFPKGGPRIAVRSLHILLGVTLVFLLVARLAWRVRWGERLPSASQGFTGYLEKVAHWALYALLASTLVLGIANAWIRGDTIFGLFTIASLAPGDKALRTQVEDLHATFANAMLIAAGLHALSGLIHHFLLRDGVLRRMLLTAKSNDHET